MPSERLQKIIAAAGIASRRAAEKLITGGAVSVNGQIVTELGTKADLERDHIRVNGKLLHGVERHVYLLMNKPKRRGAQREKTAPAKIRLIRAAENPWYEVTLVEGKNRQIRRMFEEIGHHVEKIKRVRYGPLNLDIPPGEFRRLSGGEVENLKSATTRKGSGQNNRAGR